MEAHYCVSLGGYSYHQLMRLLPRYPMAELRLDLLDLSAPQVREIFRVHDRLIATCRVGSKYSEGQRLALLREAVEAGAAFLDLERDEVGRASGLAALARRKGCRLIVSYHDFAGTPCPGRLREICRSGFESGADLVKLACMINKPPDGLRLISVLGQFRSVLAVGMGPLGLPIRFLALQFGSPFVYVCPRPGRETAPGQPSLRLFRRLAGCLGWTVP
jgi:3-dehydroquinate dehydratase type I